MMTIRDNNWSSLCGVSLVRLGWVWCVDCDSAGNIDHSVFLIIWARTVSVCIVGVMCVLIRSLLSVVSVHVNVRVCISYIKTSDSEAWNNDCLTTTFCWVWHSCRCYLQMFHPPNIVAEQVILSWQHHSQWQDLKYKSFWDQGKQFPSTTYSRRIQNNVTETDFLTQGQKTQCCSCTPMRPATQEPFLSPDGGSKIRPSNASQGLSMLGTKQHLAQIKCLN